MAQTPLANLKKISSELVLQDEIPLFGNAPPLDLQKLSSLLASRFGVSDISIEPSEQGWRTKSELKSGLGRNLIVLPIALSPISAPIFWVMPRVDVAKFTSWMLNGKAKTRALSSEILQEGFYRYLMLEVLDAIQGTLPLQHLTLQLNEEEDLPEESAFCIDIEIRFDARSCWGRLIIPSEFRKSWVAHFAKSPSDYIPSELARTTEVVVGIKTGSVLLSQEELKKIKEGDFLLLDQGSYDAKRGSGIAVLMLGQTPLFNVKIKQNKIELVDYAFYYEDNMDQKTGGAAPQKQARSENSGPSEGEVVAIKELPMYVTVELARLKISLDKLMHLNPGNMLELPIHPDQSVSLTVNGQKIGKAELVYLGETLGLRILEIGS
ncbi:MAG: type III secretion system cytoplasmic ring protein SctQ [Chlamydiota bacterium]